mmetsp:Transcript_388/g.397  ORF Transcript_388/g.397 Transcript_388/m.397 type:complete len:409 (-) Transcript_388:1521-2747(-)
MGGDHRAGGCHPLEGVIHCRLLSGRECNPSTHQTRGVQRWAVISVPNHNPTLAFVKVKVGRHELKHVHGWAPHHGLDLLLRSRNPPQSNLINQTLESVTDSQRVIVHVHLHGSGGGEGHVSHLVPVPVHGEAVSVVRSCNMIPSVQLVLPTDINISRPQVTISGINRSRQGSVLQRHLISLVVQISLRDRALEEDVTIRSRTELHPGLHRHPIERQVYIRDNLILFHNHSIVPIKRSGGTVCSIEAEHTLLDGFPVHQDLYVEGTRDLRHKGHQVLTHTNGTHSTLEVVWSNKQNLDPIQILISPHGAPVGVVRLDRELVHNTVRSIRGGASDDVRLSYIGRARSNDSFKCHHHLIVKRHRRGVIPAGETLSQLGLQIERHLSGSRPVVEVVVSIVAILALREEEIVA